MNLLPLGTVIQIRDRKALIIGYSSVTKENTSVTGYFIVSYPLGFTNIDKVVFIPHDTSFNVLAEGYSSPASERLLHTLSRTLEAAASISDEDLKKLNAALKNSISAKKEGEAK